MKTHHTVTVERAATRYGVFEAWGGGGCYLDNKRIDLGAGERSLSAAKLVAEKHYAGLAAAEFVKQNGTDTNKVSPATCCPDDPNDDPENENIHGPQHLQGGADDMRLRMAKAMCEQDGFAWDAASSNQTAHGAPPEQQRRYWLDKADAALAAMAPPHGKLTLTELDEIIEGRVNP